MTREATWKRLVELKAVEGAMPEGPFDLVGAYLGGADLVGANLQGADLVGADLIGAVRL